MGCQLARPQNALVENVIDQNRPSDWRQKLMRLPMRSQTIAVAAQEVGTKENLTDEFGELHASGIHIVGRIVLNLWRQMQASAAP